MSPALSSPENTQPLWNKSFILCLANNLFLFVFYFAQTTILPIYIVNELGGSLAQAGLAMTLFMASSIAVRPFSGLIIEKFGRKKTLYVSEALFCLFSFAYLFLSFLPTKKTISLIVLFSLTGKFRSSIKSNVILFFKSFGKIIIVFPFF